MRRFMAVVAGAASLAVALGLAGCAPGRTPGAAPFDGGSSLASDAGWVADGSLLAVVTYGSSSCAPVVSEVSARADGAVAVALNDGDVSACTDDLVPRVALVGAPEGISSGQALDLVVTYGGQRGEVEVDAATRVADPGEALLSGAPSATWIDEDVFVVVTWGSSTCVPRPEAIEQTSPGTVTVTFAEPASNVCTADLGARAFAVTTADFDAPVTSVTLVGPEAAGSGDPVTLDIQR